MKTWVILRLKTSLITGVSTGLLTPILWFIIIWNIPNKIEPYSLLSGLFAVAGIAVVAGLIISLIIGFPILLILHKLSLEQPLIVITASTIISTVILSDIMSLDLNSWALYFFAITLGISCGLIAVLHMKTYKQQIN